jgi:hypothetical protein
VNLEVDAFSGRNGSWLSAWMSFLMNAADVGLSCGDQDAAVDLPRTLAGSRQRRIGREWKQWRLARLALLHARLASSATEEKPELTDAVRHAVECFRMAPADPRCIRFDLRTVRRPCQR